MGRKGTQGIFGVRTPRTPVAQLLEVFARCPHPTPRAGPGGGGEGRRLRSRKTLKSVGVNPKEQFLFLFFVFKSFFTFIGTSLVVQLVKNRPAMRETWVPSLGWEGPQEKGKATHSSILTWRIPWAV